MLVPLDNFDEEQLRKVVAEQYDGASDTLQFVPVGEDSWSYRFGDLWISVRRDLRGHFPVAYEAASLLRDSGNDFVLAPLVGADGRAVRMVDNHPVLVFPYLHGTPVELPLRPVELADIITVIARLHTSSLSIKLGREDYELSFDNDLDWSLWRATTAMPDTGPYTARLRDLILAHQNNIVTLRTELKELGAICSASDDALVLTHGEPHPGNFFRCGKRIVLMDWGELMWGPAERDWYHIVSTLGTGPECRRDFLRFYQIRWWLSELAEYATTFFGTHSGGAHDDLMWRNLVTYFPEDC
jgi:spectinomycin phosphotransferase